ncbi:hypothetical protein LguiB_024302 [Lonicera macranthoides]
MQRLDFSGSDDLGIENLDWLPCLSSLRYIDLRHVNLSRAVHWVDKIKALPSLLFLRLASCDLSKLISPIDHTFVRTSSSFSIVTLDLSNNGFVNLDRSFNQIYTRSDLKCFWDYNISKLKLLGEMVLNIVSELDFLRYGVTHDSLHNLYGCVEVSLESLTLSGNTLAGSSEDVARFSSIRQFS